jgi:hypothetical protein
MTTTRTVGSQAGSTQRQPTVVCVVVGVLVAVGWVLYRHYWVDSASRRIFDLIDVGSRLWVVTLVFALLLSTPYALVLLWWGRGLTRAAIAALIALATGGFLWGWDRVFQHFVFGSGSASHASLQIYAWGSLLVTATLVPLAWGVARRTGAGWVAGLLVGPLVAAVVRELQLHSAWWRERTVGPGDNYRWQLQAVVFLAPFVLAILACWALEARSRPDMGSST